MPEPVDTYWQHAPHIPFDAVRADSSLARMSLCKLEHGLKDATFEQGRHKYKESHGEVNFWRRNPHQIASTLAFMVDGRTDLLRDIADKDHEPVRECLRWLDYANPFFCKFWLLTKGVFKHLHPVDCRCM